jgi:hypothetical protein
MAEQHSTESGEREFPRSPMVGWYDPMQLFSTALQTLLSKVFASRADYRLVEALGPEQPPFRYDDDPRFSEEIWIDYVADVGDGFNSTYAVALELGREEIRVRDGASEIALPRGRLLILGGDGVYPTASRAAYRLKLVKPYTNALPEEALSDEAERPHFFAIPGNHDWYDGLVGFVDLFCHRKTMGAWKLPQERSYFAILLPHRTWLLGVDIQLCADIDNRQLEYFLGLLGSAEGGAAPTGRRRDRIQPGDRVILCTAEPDWIPTTPEAERPENLIALEERLTAHGAAVILKLTGDHHHYRHHQSLELQPDGGRRHLIVAGGGGAFLHPTHIHDRARITHRGERFERTLVYPSLEDSERLGIENAWAFIARNPSFGMTTAAAYIVLSWVMPSPALESWEGPATLRHLLLQALVAVAEHTAALAWVAFILLGFVAFTDTSKRHYKWLGGLAHGAAHLTAALLISWLGVLVVRRVMAHLPGDSGGHLELLVRRLLQTAFVGGVGWFVGCLIMGLYLAISVRLFRRHWNEAYSSLKIEDYKNFLRMKLDASGLTIWAIGMDTVPRTKHWEWRRIDDRRHRWDVPAERRPTLRLIEEIRIPAAPGADPTGVDQADVSPRRRGAPRSRQGGASRS